MRSVNIQRLSQSHLDAYRELLLRSYALEPEAFSSTVQERAAEPRSWWAARLEDGPDVDSMTFGAFAHNQLVGAAALLFDTGIKTRHKALVVGLYVQPAARGQGAGQALMAALLAAARARPVTSVVQLGVSAHNAAARRLYERCGFVEFGLEPYAMRWGDDFFDECHMYCIVRPPQDSAAA